MRQMPNTWPKKESTHPSLSKQAAMESQNEKDSQKGTPGDGCHSGCGLEAEG